MHIPLHDLIFPMEIWSAREWLYLKKQDKALKLCKTVFPIFGRLYVLSSVMLMDSITVQ